MQFIAHFIFGCPPSPTLELHLFLLFGNRSHKDHKAFLQGTPFAVINLNFYCSMWMNTIEGFKQNKLRHYRTHPLSHPVATSWGIMVPLLLMGRYNYFTLECNNYHLY